MPRPRSLRSLVVSPNSKRNASPGPPSPTFSDATHASAMNFGANGPEKIITRANLRASTQAYEELMNASANYRAALMTMSQVTAAFAEAMQTCAGLKGPTYEAGTRLQAAAGLHHLIGNQWHVLAETLDKKFEKPLRQHLDGYRSIVTERSASYEKALNEKSRIIRQTEAANLNRKERNLQSFREALAVLQRQVDELDELKGQHYQEIMEHEEEVWDVVQGKVCLVIRSTLDVCDRFTSKASDPVIEPMLQSVPDPFDSYGPPQSEDQIFTILPPLSIIPSAPSASPSSAVTPELSSAEDKALGQTWVPPTSNGFLPESGSEWADVSHPSITSPRSASPPSRRNSHLPSAGAIARKAESKLRSVLSSIEETHSQRQSEDDATGDEPSTPTDNGVMSPQPFNWNHPFTYGDSPYADSNATPRNSSIYSSQAPATLPQGSDRRRSPQSDTTAGVSLAI